MHALSVDLEEYFHVSNFAGLIDQSRWDALPSRVDAPTERLLDLFDERGVVATFFALGWVAARRPRLLREIADRGHEIASHGFSHELVYDLDPARFREDVRNARSAIEDAIGVSPRGYRAPSYSITLRSLWALRILAEEGFLYDSSIFPTRHPRYGIPGFEGGLVVLELGDGLEIVELPLTIASVAGLALPVTGGAYLRLLPDALFRWGFRRAARQRPPAVLCVHPWELDVEQPRMRVSWSVGVRHYRNLEHTEARLRALLDELRFDAISPVIARASAAGAIPRRSLESLFPTQAPPPPAAPQREVNAHGGAP